LAHHLTRTLVAPVVARAGVRCAIVAVVAFAIAAGSETSAQEAPPLAQISNIRGDLYLVRVQEQATVFLATPEGIILADPLNGSVARSLRSALETQFPGRPVRYVVLTHHHFDRADGATVFLDTAVLAGHRAFNDALSKSRGSLRAELASRDHNRNGVLERDELGNDALATQVLARDRNRDGKVTRDEMYQTVASVDKVYESGQEIRLGGRIVRIVYTGSFHSNDMIALYFPSERVVFAVDHPPVTAVPFSFGTWAPGDVVRWVRTISSLDFDVLVSGDGTNVLRSEISPVHQYLDDLVASVAAARDHARPLDELRQQPPLMQYTGIRYGSADQNINQVYGSLRSKSAEVYGVAFTSYQPRSDFYCSPDSRSRGSCPLPPSSVRSGILGVRVDNGRFRGVAEVRAPVKLAFELSEGGVTIVNRDTLSTFLFGATLLGNRRYTLAALGGMSIVWEDTSATFTPPDTRVFQERNSLFGWTGGVDAGLSVGDWTSIVVHMRATRLRARNQLALSWGNNDISIGVGLAVRVFRRTTLR
jgi:glyoxylase-like metal-dependent hydrolase (beta-lactamase superfamily II)